MGSLPRNRGSPLHRRHRYVPAMMINLSKGEIPLMFAKRTVQTMLVVVAALAMLMPAPTASAKDKVREIRALGHQHPRLPMFRHGSYENVGADPDELAAARQRIAELQSMLAERDRRIGALEGQVADLESRNTQLTTDLERARQELAQRSRDLDLMAAEPEPEPVTKLVPVKVSGIQLASSFLFDVGSANLREQAKPELRRASDLLRERFPEGMLVIQGHTDSDPIRSGRYKSNWELGAARALSVMHFMIDEAGFPPTRISAQTFGQYQPMAANTTEEGKQANRRTILTVLPEMEIEPIAVE